MNVRASSPSPDGRGRRRLLVALAVALGVHAAMLLVPWCGGLPEAEPPPRVTRVTLTPVEPEAPAPQAAPEELAEVTPEVPPKPEARPQVAPRAEPTPAPSPSEPVEPVEPERHAEVAEAPTAPPQATPSPPPEAPPAPAQEAEVAESKPPPDLFPRDALEAERPQGQPEGEPDWTLAQRDPRADPNVGAEGRIKERVTRWSNDTKAVDRVRVGLYDPYFVRLRERMDATFSPDWKDFDPEDDGGVVDTLQSWLRDYQATAQRYGETGTPYHPGEKNTDAYVPPIDDEAPAGLRAVNDPAYMADAAALWRDMVHGKAGGVEVVTVVRITQEPDGTLVRVEFEQKSGRPIYDRLVLRSITAALEGAPPPEREGEGLGLKGENIVSVWKFRTRFGMAPIGQAIKGGGLLNPAEGDGPPSFGIAGVPTFGCDIGGECYWPFKRLVHPHLELMAVY